MKSAIIDSPIGPIVAISDGEAIIQLSLPGSVPYSGASVPGDDAVLKHATRELRQYFSGTRRDFSFPVRIDGTEFQEAAWEALRAIPFGETRSYGEQAQSIGKPGAARAVGQANRANRLPIVIPCHRVVASGGALGGYMGQSGDNSEMDIKAHLLKIEGALPSE